MSKPTGSMAEQFAALGIGKAKKTQEAKKRGAMPVPDFRPASARVPKVDDMVAQMAKKLEEPGEAPSERADAARLPGNLANRMEGKSVEISKLPAARPMDPSQRLVKPPSNSATPKGDLTDAARERLRYEPKRAPETVVVQQPARIDVAKTKMRKTPPPEIPGETRPFTVPEAFEHITGIVGRSTPAIEARPTRIKAADALRLDQFISRGSEWLRDHPEPDTENGYVIGFDFGTSALKVVVREPYKSGSDVAALPAPDQLRSQGHPYLWQTVVWFEPLGETFHLYPKPGAIALEGFKTGLIGGHGTDAICREPKILRSEAASAFIALHLCNILGWFEAERPLPRCEAMNFLGVNIGVPVATQDDPKALQPFKEVVLAAVELARLCEPLTLENVRGAIEMVRQEDLPAGFDLVPELSAALVGYAMDPTSPWGAHVLIDVGASTLDIVAFNLVENDDEPQIKAFAASVELLGAAALELARRQGVADDDFSKACNHQFGDTYGYASREDVARGTFSKVLRREDVQLVVTGGGCATSVHSALIADLPGRILGPKDVARPQPPEGIAAIECDRSRLLLAYGLAHDHPDIPHPTLPSRIPRMKFRTANQPVYIGPEMT